MLLEDGLHFLLGLVLALACQDLLLQAVFFALLQACREVDHGEDRAHESLREQDEPGIGQDGTLGPNGFLGVEDDEMGENDHQTGVDELRLVSGGYHHDLHRQRLEEGGLCPVSLQEGQVPNDLAQHEVDGHDDQGDDR